LPILRAVTGRIAHVLSLNPVPLIHTKPVGGGKTRRRVACLAEIVQPLRRRDPSAGYGRTTSPLKGSMYVPKNAGLVSSA
jgi:hypothetical protein